MIFTRYLAPAALLMWPALAGADSLSGSATYRERIAPPPGTVFAAVLQDLSAADDAAGELGRDEQFDAGPPPYAFVIEYDATRIAPDGRYTVRATLTSGNELLFSADTPVLAGEMPAELELLMTQVSQDVAAPAGDGAAAGDPGAWPGVPLPATYTGTVPCADCEGIAYHLDLWPSGAYHLRRQWLGLDATAAAGELRRNAVGLWTLTPETGRITLHGSGTPPVGVEMVAPDTLRLLDQSGAPIESDLPYELTSDGTLQETDIEHLLMGGMMTLGDDGAQFTDCVSGRTYPVAVEEDYPTLEAAYQADREAEGAPLYVEVTGSLLLRPATDGTDRRNFVPERLLRTRPGITCERQRADASLANTYWRLDVLDGTPMAPAGDAREAHMILHGADEPRYVATVGCNQFTGTYATNAGTLTFLPAVSTKMACPPPLDDWERSLAEMLPEVAHHRIRGETLALYDDADAVLAILSAVYLN